ncbi:hypothetical protein BGZ63DRAFT_389315 [Mariannaea sp. PMI_226]|nr:hypothetical protein BGZ63DRAFT_389315 [Mariannaea sp. PMI_226]
MSKYSHKRLIGLNKPLALTVNVLAALDLPVQLSIKVAIRTWETDQLPFAEQLVCTLAGSLVYQHGFNAIETGGTGPSTVKCAESLIATKELIMGHNEVMLSNLKQTVAETKAREEFLETLDELAKSAPELTEEVRQVTNKVKQIGDDWEDMECLMSTIEQQWRQRLKESEEHAKDARLILKIWKTYKEAYEMNKL